METLKTINVNGTDVKINEIMNEITNVLTIINDDFYTSNCKTGEFFEDVILVKYRNIDFIINLEAKMKLNNNEIIADSLKIDICPTMNTKEILYNLNYTCFNPQNISITLYQSTFAFTNEIMKSFIKTNLIYFMSNFDKAIENTKLLLEDVKNNYEKTNEFINKKIASENIIDLILFYKA